MSSIKDIGKILPPTITAQTLNEKPGERFLCSLEDDNNDVCVQSPVKNKVNPLANKSSMAVPEQAFARDAARIAGLGDDVTTTAVKTLSNQLKSKIGYKKIELSDLRKMQKAGQLGDELYDAAVNAAMFGKTADWSKKDGQYMGSLTPDEVDALANEVEKDINNFGSGGRFKMPGAIR